MDAEPLNAGSWRAILWELRHGDVWTVMDEIMHAFDWLPVFTGARYRFCQWAHGRKLGS